MTSQSTRIFLSLVGVLAVLASACSDSAATIAETTGESPTNVGEVPTTTTTTTATVATTTTSTTIIGATTTSDRPSDVPDVVAARGSAGCGVSDAGAAVEDGRFLIVDGLDRRYLLTVPAAHDGQTPIPVVFDFHGLSEGAEIHARMSQYSSLAESEGFVAVFPHGTGEPVQWNINPGVSNADLGFFDALVADVGQRLCVDLARVYATGLSMGAMFTSLLLCERADVLAAAAPVAGITDIPGCAPARPVPLLAIHGTDDPILLFNGGVDVSKIPGGEPTAQPTTTTPAADLDGDGYPANVAAFAARNGCDPTPTDTDVTEEVVHRVYDCPPGSDVEFSVVLGGGHSWPGSALSQSVNDLVGYTTFDVDATADAWAFFKRHANAAAS